MIRRPIPVLAAAAAALALVTVPSPAEAGLDDKCFGQVPNVVGTNGNDDIYVSTDEGGTFIRINGKESFKATTYVAISAGDGRDKIRFGADPGDAVVCAGRGDDTIEGTLINGISAGAGNDRVDIYIQCGDDPVIYGAESVHIRTDFESDPGPCN